MIIGSISENRDLEKRISITPEIAKKYINLGFKINEYKDAPGDYSEGAIPDSIPNSEVKPFSADGTLS